MDDTERLARRRYYAMQAVNIIGCAGAVLGLYVAGRSTTQFYTLIGGLMTLSSLYLMAVVPKAMAKRWKTPNP